jgi:hypothetical protein
MEYLKLINEQNEQKEQNEQNEQKELFGGIDLTTITEENEKEIEAMMVHPMTKDEAHFLWNIKNLNEKKEKFLEVIKKFSFMKNEYIIKKLAKVENVTEVDFLITNFLLKTEESCKAKNIRTLIKLKLITLEEN